MYSGSFRGTMAGFKKNIFIFTFLIVTASILFLAFTYVLGKILIQDISIEPVQNSSYQPGVYLVSYADGAKVHIKNQNVLAASAINKGIDFILNYRRVHLDAEFIKQNAAILNGKKGGGFWLWKPWIILNTLERIPENAIVIYLDAGILLRASILNLAKLAMQNEIILFEYDSTKYSGKPINITKREIFLELDCDRKQCHYGSHVWAGALILRNTKNSRAFIKEWLHYCSKEKLITDELYVEQHPEFVKQYHDEAILNALYNKDPKGKYLLQSKVFFDEYATWHHRFQKEDYVTIMANHHNDDTLAYAIQNDLLNNFLSVSLRKVYRLWSTE